MIDASGQGISRQFPHERENGGYYADGWCRGRGCASRVLVTKLKGWTVVPSLETPEMRNVYGISP